MNAQAPTAQDLLNEPIDYTITQESTEQALSDLLHSPKFKHSPFQKERVKPSPPILKQSEAKASRTENLKRQDVKACSYLYTRVMKDYPGINFINDHETVRTEKGRVRV